MPKSKILVLDDHMLIAFETASVLENDAFEVVGPFCSVDDALKGMAEQPPDAAVLDINMGDGTTSEPLADILMRKNIPFAFMTGYGSAGVLPPRFQTIEKASKPLRRNEVLALATRLTKQASAQ